MMTVEIVIDTKPKGQEYMRAGSIIELDEAEGSRLCYLGFAKKVEKKKSSKKK